MPRLQKSYCSPAKLICPVEGCRKKCQTYSGLTQHLHAKHNLNEYQPGTSSNPSTAAANDRSTLDSSDLSSVNLEMPDGDPAGAWDAFGSESNHDSDFGIPLLPSSRQDSPSRETEASDSTVDYHPIINGQ